jgi:hypothetical protein
MSGSIYGVIVLVVTAGWALNLSCQTERIPVTDVPKTPRRVTSPIAQRISLTATFQITREKPQADGSILTQESTEVMAWDSQRRQMTSITTIPQSEDQTPTTKSVVVNRMAHTISRWSLPGRQVTVTKLPENGPGVNMCAATLNLSLIEPTEISPLTKAAHGRPITQSLGTKTIHDVEARGSRTTWITPVGAVGNSEPLVRTREIWFATEPGLDLVVRTIEEDPLFGKRTRELEDLDRYEPYSSVFEPPANYATVNEDAPACPASSPKKAESPSAQSVSPPESSPAAPAQQPSSHLH